jgi:hypothetical protein
LSLAGGGFGGIFGGGFVVFFRASAAFSASSFPAAFSTVF